MLLIEYIHEIYFMVINNLYGKKASIMMIDAFFIRQFYFHFGGWYLLVSLQLQIKLVIEKSIEKLYQPF